MAADGERRLPPAAAAGLALTWATHELVFILIFIGGSFLGLRALWEWRPRVFQIACGVAVLATALVVGALLTVPSTGATHSWLERLLGPAMMLGQGVRGLLPAYLRANLPEPQAAGAWHTITHAR